jgi:trehalose-phosphatase
MKAQGAALSQKADGAPHTVSLFDHLSEIAGPLNAAGHVFLFLDFDGTLAAIVDEPVEATIAAGTRSSLIRLSRRSEFSVAVISGRAVGDLEARVAVEGLTYGGDHGLAIRGPGLKFVEQVASRRKPVLSLLLDDLEGRLKASPGVRIERKDLSASVHYRGVPEGQHGQLRQTVTDSVAATGGLFEVTQGLLVLEIRPRVEWNKGAAALWIMKSCGKQDALPVFLGDDSTDEDAFAALANGITVRVGQATATVAKYRLEHQESVGEFLAWLAELDRTPGPVELPVRGDLG